MEIKGRIVLPLGQEAKTIYEEITDKILKASYRVYNVLGYGFLEKVYENALGIELIKYGFFISQKRSIPVYYDGQLVGDYVTDIIVNDLIVLELKSVAAISKEHFAQLTNYLKATDIEVGLLLKFGKKPEFQRMILPMKLGAEALKCLKKITFYGSSNPAVVFRFICSYPFNPLNPCATPLTLLDSDFDLN